MKTVTRILYIAAMACLAFVVGICVWAVENPFDEDRGIAFLGMLILIVLSVICFALSAFFEKIGEFVDHFGPMFEGFRPVQWSIDSKGNADLQMHFDPDWAAAHIKRGFEEGMRR